MNLVVSTSYVWMFSKFSSSCKLPDYWWSIHVKGSGDLVTRVWDTIQEWKLTFTRYYLKSAICDVVAHGLFHELPRKYTVYIDIMLIYLSLGSSNFSNGIKKVWLLGSITAPSLNRQCAITGASQANHLGGRKLPRHIGI